MTAEISSSAACACRALALAAAVSAVGDIGVAQQSGFDPAPAEPPDTATIARPEISLIRGGAVWTYCRTNGPEIVIRFEVSDAHPDYLSTIPRTSDSPFGYFAYQSWERRGGRFPYTVRMELLGPERNRLFFGQDEFHISYSPAGRLSAFRVDLDEVLVMTNAARLPSLSGNWGISEWHPASYAPVDLRMFLTSFTEHERFRVGVYNEDGQAVLRKEVSLPTDPTTQDRINREIDLFMESCIPAVQGGGASGGASGILR
jgi:hypothetical protein